LKNKELIEFEQPNFT